MSVMTSHLTTRHTMPASLNDLGIFTLLLPANLLCHTLGLLKRPQTTDAQHARNHDP